MPRAADLMQALNLMIGDDRRLIFIIGLDRQKVAAGLAVKFKELVPYLAGNHPEALASEPSQAGIAFGYGFIEKFIQLPFQVPAADEEELARFLKGLRPRAGKTVENETQIPQKEVKSLERQTSWRTRLRDRIKGRGTRRNPPEPDPRTEAPRGEERAAAEASSVPGVVEEATAGKKRHDWDDFALTVTEDSANVDQVVKLAAPALGYNPRRMKQLVNVFRLRAYIAYNTGLFNLSGDERLTFEQLGKFVGLELRWPLLLVDMRHDPGLLPRLSRYAEAWCHWRAEGDAQGQSRTTAGEDAGRSADAGDIPARWKADRELLAFLAGHTDPQGESESYWRYSLTRLDASRLLKVSPRVTPPQVPPPEVTLPERREAQEARQEAVSSRVAEEGTMASPSSGEELSTPGPAPPEIEMVRIPAGPFIMGDDEGDDDEKPQHEVYLNEYEIAKYPLTNAQYKAFIEANPDHEAPEDWQDRSFPEGKERHPVVYISWHDAQAFARWLSDRTGQEYRLPTEAEWEKAARGADGRKYPWGAGFDPKKCNTSEGGPGGTTPVGSYPEGASPYEIMDMAGNVWEWCADWYEAEYYKRGEARNPQGPEQGEARVVRGGSWRSLPGLARCASRYGLVPVDRSAHVGVRFSRTL